MPVVNNEQPRKGGFSLGDYVEVKDRIRLFYERYPDGRLVTEEVRWPEPMDDVPRISVKALAYRTPDDPHPGVGWSWMVLPGSTTYTRGSELENTETSAWGRAIGSLGIGIDKSIASVDEIGAKGGEAERKVETQERTEDGGLIGTAEIHTAPSDFELRGEPEGGYGISFKLVSGRTGFKVIAHDPLATQLYEAKSRIIGQRVICWGSMGTETFRPKAAKRDVSYPVLTLTRIHAPDSGLELPRPDQPPIAPGQETLPLTDDEKAAIVGDLG